MLGMNYTFRFQEKEHCVFEKKVMVKKIIIRNKQKYSAWAHGVVVVGVGGSGGI